MKRKGKLWMACWRDAQGRRRRKGFTNHANAEQYQNQMRKEARAKKAPTPEAPSPPILLAV